MESENLIGRWAVCGRGRIGRIEGRKVLDWGPSWIGTGLDGHPWASRSPHLVSDGDAALLHDVLARREALAT